MLPIYDRHDGQDGRHPYPHPYSYPYPPAGQTYYARYMPSISAPPTVAIPSNGHSTVALSSHGMEEIVYTSHGPVLRPPTRLHLPSIGNMIPQNTTERLYPASFPPAMYPISPYFATSSQAAWRPGTPYATSTSAHGTVVYLAHPPPSGKVEERSGRVPSQQYDFRDYLIHEDDEAVGPLATGKGNALALSSTEDAIEERVQAISPLEAPFAGTSLHRHAAESAQGSAENQNMIFPENFSRQYMLDNAWSRSRTRTITQQNENKRSLMELVIDRNYVSSHTLASVKKESNDDYDWHLPMSGMDYFAGHNRAISAERSTHNASNTSPVVTPPMPEEIGFTKDHQVDDRTDDTTEESTRGTETAPTEKSLESLCKSALDIRDEDDEATHAALLFSGDEGVDELELEEMMISAEC